MLDAILHNLERDSDVIHEVRAFLALMNFLNDSFDLRVFGSGRIDEVIARHMRAFLLMPKVEGILVAFDEVLKARIVDFVIEVRVYSSLVVEVEQSQNVCPLNHNQAVKPSLTEVQKVLILLKQDLLMDLLEEDASIARIRLTITDNLSISTREY